MIRALWAAGLAGVLAFICWQYGFLMGLPAPYMDAAQGGLTLLAVVCLVGVILPERWSPPVQMILTAFGFVGVFGCVAGAL